MPLLFEYMHSQKEEEKKVEDDENDVNDVLVETPEKIVS